VTYRIEWRLAALKEVEALARDVRARIVSKVESLAANPRPPGCSKLAGQDNEYRVRVGDWRIIYGVEDRVLLVLVLRVRHRREAYR
jgi:mRNA interferase RelE/StbE